MYILKETTLIILMYIPEDSLVSFESQNLKYPTRI